MSSLISQPECRPARDATRALVALLIAVFAPCTSFGQAVLPGADVRVSDSFTANGPSITGVVDGLYVVAWDTLARPFSPDGSYQGNIRVSGGSMMPFIISYPELATVHPERMFCPSGPGGVLFDYRYIKSDGISKSPFTQAFLREGYCNFMDGEYERNDILHAERTEFDGTIAVLADVQRESFSVGLYFSKISCTLYAVSRTSGSMQEKEVHATAFGNLVNWDTLGHPLMGLSPRHGNELAILKKSVLSGGAPPSLKISVLIFDQHLDQVGEEIELDTLFMPEADRLQRITLTDSTLCVYYVSAGEDTTFADVYGRSGMPLAKRKPVFSRSDSAASGTAFCQGDAWTAVTPPGNTAYFIWSKCDGENNADIYIQAFDENLEPLAAPKRVNADTTGNSILPVADYWNDKIYIAWARNYTGDWGHIFTKQISVDAVTGIEPVHKTESFSIRSVYPQPATSFVTINCTAPESVDDLDLRIHNILGVEMLRRIYDPARSIVFDCSAYPQGIYFATLRQGGSATSSLFLVRR